MADVRAASAERARRDDVVAFAPAPAPLAQCSWMTMRAIVEADAPQRSASS
jgi:hypothetical protein